MIKELIVDFVFVIEYELCVVSYEYLLNGKLFIYLLLKLYVFYLLLFLRKILKLNKNNKEVEILNFGSWVERLDLGISRFGIMVGWIVLVI